MEGCILGVGYAPIEKIVPKVERNPIRKSGPRFGGNGGNDGYGGGRGGGGRNNFGGGYKI